MGWQFDRHCNIVECVPKCFGELSGHRAQCFCHRVGDFRDRISGENLSIGIEIVQVGGVSAAHNLRQVDVDLTGAEVDFDDPGLISQFLIDQVFNDRVESSFGVHGDRGGFASDLNLREPENIEVDSNGAQLIEEAIRTEGIIECGTCSSDDLVQGLRNAFDCGAGNREDSVGYDVVGGWLRAIAACSRGNCAEFKAEVVNDFVGDSGQAKLVEKRCQVDLGVACSACIDIVEIDRPVFADCAGAGQRIVVRRSVAIRVERADISKFKETTAVCVTDKGK